MTAVAVVPTFRNLTTLPQVLRELGESGLPIIAIDDGSEDGTSEFLVRWSQQAAGRVALLRTQNAGKARALLDGLEAAAAAGHDIALTMDSDGQHLIQDALRVLAAASPDALVCGARDVAATSYPWTSLLGRRIWSLGVRALTGLGVSDPVCGLRAYPIARILQLRCVSGRFAWEEEALVRAAWSGVQIRQVPIQCVYAPAATRVSHYRIRRDWGESLRIWARLAALELTFGIRKVPVSQPLTRSDASRWWLYGAAVMAGITLGALLHPMLALPLVFILANRAHAGVWLAPLAALVSAALERFVSPGAAIASAGGVNAAIVTAALISLRWARFPGSS